MIHNMKSSIFDYLEMNIESLQQNLADATAKLIEMDGSETEVVRTVDKDGKPKEVVVNLRDQQRVLVDSLTKDLNDLMKTYNDIVNPRIDPRTLPQPELGFFDKHGDAIIRSAATALVVAASITETILLYKWNTQGYIPGRDATRVKMPRPI